MPEAAGHFPQKAISYRALLRKMTSNDKVSYESSPPCNDKINLKLKSGNTDGNRIQSKVQRRKYKR